MTELVPYTRTEVGSYDADWLLDPAEIAQRIGGTEFVPAGIRDNPAAITAALLYGSEVGLGRMQSLAKIAVINGRPTLAAEAQRALILAAGHELWIDESTTTRCIVAGRRRGSTHISRITWTIDDATRAGLAGKQPWRMYPRQMLLARASAELARAIFPDAIGGLAATEEYEDEPPAPETNDVPKPGRRRRRAAAAPAEPAALPAAETGLPPEEAAVLDELEKMGAKDEGQGSGAADEGPQEANESLDSGDPAPDPISGEQRAKLHAMFREKGVPERTDRLRYCERVVGRELKSSNELTKDEASVIIDRLELYDPNEPEPADELF
jgi:hypothetical protein